MDEVIPGLWIGGLSSALSIEYLTQAGVTHIITCMKQRLPPPPTLLNGRTISQNNMRQVRVDDLEQAPILAHFASCNEFIAEALKEEWVSDPPQHDRDAEQQQQQQHDGEQHGDSEESSAAPSPASDQKVGETDEASLLVQGRQKRHGRWGHWQTTGTGTVLVHCQAGCSRSVAIAAAYLMSTRRISAALALRMIQARRSRAQPNAGFMAQLELYEQVGFEIDMRHQAVRRYLMSKTDILNGDSFDDMLLSYYPSPYPSPALSQGLKGLSSLSTSSSLDETPLLDSAAEDARPADNGSSSSRDPRRGTVAANSALSTSPTTKMGDHFTRLSTHTGSSSIRQSEEVRVTKNSGRLPGGVETIKGHEGLSNRGQLPKPTFQGPKLRCKACRRELAALDHVIEHQEGQGQLAFEHRKREAGNAKYASQSRVTDTSANEGSPIARAETGALEMQQRFGARPAAVRKVVDDDAADGAQSEQGAEAQQAQGKQGEQTEGAQEQHASGTAVGASAAEPAATAPAPSTRRIQSASSLTARLPPHLAALRGHTRPSVPAPPSSTGPAPSSPSASTSVPTSTQSTATASHPTAAAGPSQPILHSSACSAYFIEPMAWMTQLSEGEVCGKLACPATKCGVKLGSWDWAGMQCGCGAWVTPAFALHRSKVDEV